jgi:hypothetical protein
LRKKIKEYISKILKNSISISAYEYTCRKKIFEIMTMHIHNKINETQTKSATFCKPQLDLPLPLTAHFSASIEYCEKYKHYQYYIVEYGI